MAKWISLDAVKLNRPRDAIIRGANVQVHVSPYDVPDAVAARYNENLKRLLVDFKCVIRDEDTQMTPHADGFTLIIGKKSGRVYRIEIDVDRLQLGRVGVQVLTTAPDAARVLTSGVDRAIDSLGASAQTGPRAENYRVVKEIIAERAQELLEPLATG
jgi:hypothetical protein